jgi:hypothetical protein
MSRLPCCLVLLALTPPATADSLSASDRQLLLERLGSIKNAAEDQVGERISTAVAAFRSAMASNEAALALYIKCIEKLDFDDQQRTSQDFREWKRKQRERLDDPALQTALRHQLQWLILTLEVAAEPDKINHLGPKAAAALDSIFAHASELEGQRELLRQPVTSSAFARAYNITNLKVAGWPTEPLAIGEIYQKVILPPLRNSGAIEPLKAAWLNRIQQEAMLRSAWSGDNGRGSRTDGATPAAEKFLTDERPDLLWQMEEDLFKAGDQRNAALRMLDHLDRYISHPKAPAWAARFIGLIAPAESPPAEAGSPAPPP